MRTSLCCLLALTALTVTPAWAAAPKACGDIPEEGVSPAAVTAYGTTCTKARSVARKASKVADAPFNGCVRLTDRLQLKKPCVVAGFRCRTIRRTGYKNFGIRVGCHRGSQRVAWTLE